MPLLQYGRVEQLSRHKARDVANSVCVNCQGKCRRIYERVRDSYGSYRWTPLGYVCPDCTTVYVEVTR